MNAATRVITQGSYASRPIVSFPLPSQQLQVLVLVAAVLFSALGFVYVKDLNRRLFIGYQTQQQQFGTLQSKWSKLMLEESTWSSQARVQQIAEEKLGMYLPTAKDVVLVKLDSEGAGNR